MDLRPGAAPIYAFGAYRLNAARLLLERDGSLVPLTPRLFATLLYLVENAGRTVRKDEMLRALWPGRVAEEANLSQAISALRRALSADAPGDALIVTIPGQGYRFTGAVEIERPEITAEPSTAVESAVPNSVASDSAPGLPIRRPLRLRALGVAGGLAVAALGFGAWWAWGRSPPLRTGRTAVVLADLQNFTGDRAFDHVIPRVVQVDLAQSPFLQVVPDATVARTLALMEQPKDTPLGRAAATSVCARNNGGAVVIPAIASLGSRFVLTLTAFDCVSGRTFYDGRQDVSNKEGVAGALDSLSSQMRQRLGEAQASIAKFDVTLAPERTASFAALEAYSEGVWRHEHGRELDAIALYKHAIELDPEFAMAYLKLAECYYGLHQPISAGAAMTKAYERKNLVSEPNALLINSLYSILVTRNFGAALQSAKMMTQLYPRDPLAWQFVSNIAYRTGDYGNAVIAGRHAVELDPRQSSSYTVLARALNYDGKTAQADKLAAVALRMGPESGQLRQQRIAWRFLLGDAAGAERLVAASAGTPFEREALIEAYNFAFGEGRVRHAQELIARAALLGRPDGFKIDWTSQASNYAKVGLDGEALEALRQVSPELWTGEDDYYAARLEAPGRAAADLARDLAHWPQDTILHAKYAPEARAALLLRRGRPLEAARLLDSTGSFMFQELDVGYLRAVALLAANDGPAAAAGFRAVLAHPGFGWDPQFALAHLGLARALRLQSDIPASRREYERFLAVWKNADADLPPLRQARIEYAALTNRAGT